MSGGLLDQAEFAENPEPRCPVVLLLDTSGSMEGRPIQELNNGLVAFSSSIKEDRLAALRVEVAMITFGGEVEAIDLRSGTYQTIPFDATQAFVTVDQFLPPVLEPNGDTDMGGAMRRALQLLRDRKDIYKQAGLDYYRPWIFLITDGQPTDVGWESAADQAREEETRKGVLVFPVGVEGADMEILARFSNRQPLKLQGLAFRAFFQWVSKSVSAVAETRPGDQVALPPVTWAQIDTSR
jgi:uncharacterized protein YegL